MSKSNCWTRLLHPFLFSRCAPNALGALLRDVSETSSFHGKPLWQAAVPDDDALYLREMLEPARALLFDQQPGGCRFLQVNPDALAYAFCRSHSATLKVEVPRKSSEFSISIAPHPGIELWLSPLGFGVLSIAFEVECPIVELTTINYQLSQLDEKRRPRLRITSTQRAAPAAAEGSQDLLESRLGRLGADFDLTELIGWVLSPLKLADYRPFLSKQLAVHTAIRMGPGLNFNDPLEREGISHAMSTLSLLEDPQHAGISVAEWRLPNALLSGHHWAAVSHHASAHVLTDQGIAFDAQRLEHARDRYFVPFLVCWLQHLFLETSRCATGTIFSLMAESDGVSAEVPASSQSFAKLTGHYERLLAAEATLFLTEVSSRNRINDFYVLAQQGLRIQKGLSGAHRMLSAVAEYHRATEGHRLQHELNEMQAEMKQMQSSAEWVEVLIVAFYSTNLIKFLDSVFDFHTAASKLASLVFTGTVWAAALMVLKPFEHASSERQKRMLRMFMLIAFALVTYWVVGVAAKSWEADLHPAPAAEKPAGSALPASSELPAN